MIALLKRYKVAIDLGGQKLCVWIAEENKEGGFLKLLATDYVACKGVWSGSIVNMAELEECLVGALYEIEKKSKFHIRHVDLVLNNSFFTFDYHQHSCTLDKREVYQDDIDFLREMVALSQHHKILTHLIPIEFVVDQQNNIQDPVGLKGNTLRGLFHGIWMDNNLYDTLVSCFRRYHITIDHIFNSALCSGWSCLTPEEKDLGSVICDIGANCTSIGVFYKNTLMECFTVYIGGHSVTEDISKACSVHFNHGERLKILYGANIDTLQDHENFIPIFQEDEEELSISRGFLIQLIQKRYKELLFLIKQRLDFSPYYSISHHIVLTGGGSQSPGLKDMAQHILERQVRIGKPIALQKGERFSGEFSAITGILVNKNFFNNFNKKENIFLHWMKRGYNKIINKS